MTYLDIITGPMFSGKTSSLLYKISKLSVLINIYIINSTLDNRYNNYSITTHCNYSCDAVLLENLDLECSKKNF